MQSTHKIAGSAAAGFAAYLTTSASRGDYYVGGELEGAQRANKTNAQEASVSRDDAQTDRQPSRFVQEIREAMGRSEPRHRERVDASPPGSFGEQLRRIQREQREHERDQSEGLEL